MKDYKKQAWEIELEKALSSISDKEREVSMNKKIGASEGGKRGGLTNKTTGHMKRIQKENAHLGGLITGSWLGKNYGKYNMDKMSREDKVRGAKIAGKKAVESGTLLKASKLGAKISTEKRIERKMEKYTSIIKLIRKKEFTLMDVQNACIKFGIEKNYFSLAKKIVKEKTLIKQIHKGYNQFNPSIYIKVK